MRLVTLILLGCVGLTSAESGEKTTWGEYANGRFGFVLSYPALLIGSREAMNGDGREFHTADHEFSVAAFAHFFVPESGDSFEKRWQDELSPSDKATINYKKKTLNWYVVSGTTKEGFEFYHKLYRQGANWAAFHITYPHSKTGKYDTWVAEIEKRFIPFREGEFDRID